MGRLAGRWVSRRVEFWLEFWLELKLGLEISRSRSGSGENWAGFVGCPIALGIAGKSAPDALISIVAKLTESTTESPSVLDKLAVRQRVEAQVPCPSGDPGGGVLIVELKLSEGADASKVTAATAAVTTGGRAGGETG